MSTSKDVRKRTVSLDFLDGYVQSNLTVSTLMVGVALTLMGMVPQADVATASTSDATSIINAQTWYHLVTLSSWMGFLASGGVFGWSLILQFLLQASAPVTCTQPQRGERRGGHIRFTVFVRLP
jgi:hypothetical protein